MASRYWIKLHHELLNDPRMGRLSDSQFRLAINLMLLAGDYEQGGLLPVLEDVRWRLREPEHFEADLAALVRCGVLTEEDDGSLYVSQFAERQGAMSAEERSQLRQKRVQKADDQAHEKCTKSARIVQQTARKSHESGIDKDKDKEVEKEKDEDEDADADARYTRTARACTRTRGSGINPEDPLVKCFLEQSGLPLYSGGKQKWASALQRLKANGVSAEDVRTALGECQAKQLVIASLASIVNPAMIAKARRTASRAPPGEDYRRYLKGQYGDFGVW